MRSEAATETQRWRWLVACSCRVRTPPAAVPLTPPLAHPALWRLLCPCCHSVYTRITRHQCQHITPAEELADWIVLLLDGVTATACEASPAQSDAAATADQHVAAASSSGAIATAAAHTHGASSAVSLSLTPSTTTHLFTLLQRYSTECTRVARYLSLDTETIWEHVRRASRYTLTTLNDTEKISADALTFERGDSETRVRLVLTELRQISIALQKKRPTGKDAGLAASAPQIPQTPSTPMKPQLLARVTSTIQSSAHVAAAAQSTVQQQLSFLSPLLTNDLFADELQRILPVLFLKCRGTAASPSQSQSEDDDEDVEMTAAPAAATEGASSSSPTAPPAFHCFLPLRSLLQVLLHQGPSHGARYLLLLATTRPFEMNAIVEEMLVVVKEALEALEEKLDGLSASLSSILNHSAQLTTASQQIWQCAYSTVRSGPLATAYAFLVQVSQLAPTELGLYIRTRLMHLMEELRIAPPNLPGPSSGPSFSLDRPPSLGSTVAAASSSTSVAPPTPAAPSSVSSTQTPSRPRTIPVPAPVSISAAGTASASKSNQSTPAPGVHSTPAAVGATPSLMSSSSLSSSMTITAAYLTPSFLSTFLPTLWSPLVHYLPSLVLAVTLAAVKDDVAFLTGVIGRVNGLSKSSALSSAESTAPQILLAYLQTSQRSVEYTDIVGQAVREANASAAEKATQALHEKAQKARAELSSTESSGRKRKLNESSASSAASAGPPGKAAATGKDRQGKMVMSRDTTFAAPVSASSSSRPLHSSARSGTPSTSPQLSSTRAPGQAPTAVSGSPQQHRGFASPSLGSVNRNEAGMMTPSRRGLFGPGFSGSNYAQHSSSVSASLCRSSANMFQYGSIDYLRSKLLFHLDRCRFTLSKQIDSLRLHLGAWMDAARVVRLEVMMMLYAGYQPRSPEMEVIINFLPSSHQLQEKHLTALDAIGVHAFMELLQMLVTFACVCPYVCMPSASPIHSSRSTPPPSSTAQYLPLFLSLRSHYFPLAVKAQRSVITERGDSEKAERYLLQQPGAHAGSREPILVENLLQQVGVSGVIGRPTDLTHLLRSLLKLPGHFKPALLNPYVDRVTPHMKEIQSMVSTQVYTKMELVEECFLRAWETSERKQQHGARKLIHQSEGEAIFTLSPSAYSSLSFHHSLTSCAYLLRNSSNGSSSSSGLSSHLTRPFFQSHAGWWMARVMKTVVRRSDNDGISSPLDHPFSCHPLSFTLLDSLLTFSLSACIQDHLHLQPLGAQQHRCETTERDGRAWEERGMKEFISELCPPADAPFTPIDRLANPCGLAWMLYYVLHHNAMAMAMWTKASSSNASAAYLPPAPDAEMSTVPLPPPSSKEAMSGNYSATYTALGLPPPPFSASVAQAVSVGSAVLPYGSHVLDNVPMRGVLEWVKQQVQRYANDKSHTVLHSNFTALFLHLLRLLSRLHPDSLVGFSIPSSLLGVGVDAAKIDAIGWVEKEGSLGVMRFGEQEEEVKQETAVKSEDTKMSDAQSSPRRLPSKSLLSSESAEVESFLRALANPEQICLSASEAEARWCSLYSRSTISGSQFVHRTLLAALLAKRNDSSSPPSWNDLLMNPCLLIDASTFTPLSQLSVTPHLLRIFLTCVFHVIVASTSFFSTYSRTEAFSLQLVRQSLYHSTYSSWLSALQLLLPSPDACSPLSSSSFSRFTSQQQKIYQDPLALWSQKEVEKATRELWQSERRQQERSKTGSSATAALATSALAAAETEERTAKKARRASTNDLAATIKQESTEVKAKEESTDATVKDEPMQIDAEQKNDSAAAVPTSEDVKVEPIVAAAAPSSSAATSSAAPRPFSFLVSDRLLSAADQVTFSNEFALGAESPASTENAAAGAQTTMSPALRAFIYLLTTRASIAHAVLDAAAALHVKAPQHLVPAEAASLGVLFAFLRLLFTSSTSADSSSPSSLFLLLHIQGYSPSLLPRMKREFPVLIGQLLEEGVVKERVQRGVGGSEVERQQHAKFVQQLCEKEEKTPAVAASGVKMEL